MIPRNMYAYGADWTGVDISDNQISYAKQLSQEAGMDIHYYVSAAEAIDFPDGKFDVFSKIAFCVELQRYHYERGNPESKEVRLFPARCNIKLPAPLRNGIRLADMT